MRMRFVQKDGAEIQLGLDAEALETVSAVLRFTSPLNNRRRQLSRKLERLLAEPTSLLDQNRTLHQE